RLVVRRICPARLPTGPRVMRAGLRSVGVVAAVLALATCSSTSATPHEEALPAYPHKPLPPSSVSVSGQTPFAFAGASDAIADTDLEHCMGLIEARTSAARSVGITAARDGLIFEAPDTPAGSDVVDLATAVDACDLGLSFFLADPVDTGIT